MQLDTRSASSKKRAALRAQLWRESHAFQRTAPGPRFEKTAATKSANGEATTATTLTPTIKRRVIFARAVTGYRPDG